MPEEKEEPLLELSEIVGDSAAMSFQRTRKKLRVITDHQGFDFFVSSSHIP